MSKTITPAIVKAIKQINKEKKPKSIEYFKIIEKKETIENGNNNRNNHRL